MPMLNPPLLGDGHGRYRIHIVGNSGTGKSTLAAYLSVGLNIPHISLDKISWKPGWKKVPTDEFRENVCAQMAQNTEGWIIDGRCGKLGTFVPDNATDIIWLDPPLYYYLPRLVWRTLMRILGFFPPCAEGCEENWSEIFSKSGIVWWCITNHAVLRTKYASWLSLMSREAGGKMIRLDESQAEVAKWKADLKSIVTSRPL